MWGKPPAFSNALIVAGHSYQMKNLHLQFYYTFETNNWLEQTISTTKKTPTNQPTNKQLDVFNYPRAQASTFCWWVGWLFLTSLDMFNYPQALVFTFCRWIDWLFLTSPRRVMLSTHTHMHPLSLGGLTVWLSYPHTCWFLKHSLSLGGWLFYHP